jgi:hypothetical protein
MPNFAIVSCRLSSVSALLAAALVVTPQAIHSAADVTMLDVPARMVDTGSISIPPKTPGTDAMLQASSTASPCITCTSGATLTASMSPGNGDGDGDGDGTGTGIATGITTGAIVAAHKTLQSARHPARALAGTANQGQGPWA